jgi:DNA-3-methyladenine glycosylase
LKKLSRAFYLRPTLIVARDLLGKYLVRQVGKTKLVGRIVEVEAYRQNDPASHAFGGRTKRNDVMFWEGGHLYVYFTYGMHFCANVVTGKAGIGEAVLIRAIEPVEGIDEMIRNRFRTITGKKKLRNAMNAQLADNQSPLNLTNGPAKLCEALAIRRETNGTDLLGDEIYLLNAPGLPSSKVNRSTRIGITNGKEKKWRFSIKGNPWVSR